MFRNVFRLCKCVTLVALRVYIDVRNIQAEYLMMQHSDLHVVGCFLVHIPTKYNRVVVAWAHVLFHWSGLKQYPHLAENVTGDPN